MGEEQIPLGFHFRPTDKELLLDYLAPRIKGEPLPWKFVVDKDLYGEKATPWEIFTHVNDPWETITEGCDHHQHAASGKKKKAASHAGKSVRVIYAFTTLSRKSKKMISRKAGCGTWKGQTGEEFVLDEESGVIIGSKKMLTFVPDSGFEEDGHWIMHEYSLAGHANMVICKITRVDHHHQNKPFGVSSKSSSLVADYLSSSTPNHAVLGKRKIQEPNYQDYNNNSNSELMTAAGGAQVDYNHDHELNPYSSVGGSEIQHSHADWTSAWSSWNVDDLIGGLDHEDYERPLESQEDFEWDDDELLHLIEN